MIFRIDDIGTSAKEFEQHGQKWFKLFGKKLIYFPFANFWFLKRIKPFKKWAKYDELTADEWKVFLKIFERHGIIPIVAVTATWVDKDSNLIPFPEKFPEEAAVLKQAYKDGKIIIANHSLAHCIVGKHMPRFWGSNRSEWREFIPRLPEELHHSNILKSQEILEGFFEKPIEIFVPPGNVWSVKTYRALLGSNLKTVMSSQPPADGQMIEGEIVFKQDDAEVVAFHDKELKLYGEVWLEELIEKNMHKGSKIEIANSALPYILFQRTGYLHGNIIFKALSMLGMFKPFYKLSVNLKSLFFANKIKAAFSADMVKEFETLKTHLPTDAESILDIGCGVAGIDVLLSRHYDNGVDIYLLDKTSIDPSVYYGFKDKGSVYNSLDVSKDLLVQNGVKGEHIYMQEATSDNKITFSKSFDVVISLISWGFHYPVDTYIKEVYEKLKAGGILIIDIRKGTGGEESVDAVFGRHEVIFESSKLVRIIARK